MTRLLIVGNPEPIHLGAHLRAAADACGIAVELCDTRTAFAGSWLARQWNWRARGHRPPRLEWFNAQVIAMCERFEPSHLIVTGIAPLAAQTLAWFQEQHIRTLNYLTDDPWNPSQSADWFLDALSGYDVVFTPRHANVNDLRAAGCANVEFLPFAYNPQVHYPDPQPPEAALACDVMFAGGADADRVPFLGALIKAGIAVHLYGGYWSRFRATRRAARGHADAALVRRAVKNARVCLNLVRRANRDDHVMRTFEIPAMGGCMLTEDTEMHRTWFGPEGQTVFYFQTETELVEKARRLLALPAEREAMAQRAYEHILAGKHTWRDRLETMLAEGNGAQA